MSLHRLGSAVLVSAFVVALATPASAAPPVPSGGHPRLFMSQPMVDAFKAKSQSPSSASSGLVKRCNDAISNPQNYTTRGGADGEFWPGSAIACAFAYRITGDAKYLAPAVKYWHASLDDDQNLGDKLGCIAGVNTNWQTWDGNPPAPPVIITVTHDTGYPMRWYAPYIALTYDWLHDAPGVDDALRTQTQVCLSSWVDWYSKNGYHHDEAGANYNAGFLLGKVLAGIAIGNDNGADGHVWNEASTLVQDLLVGDGLKGATSPIGQPAGAMVGGDWAEGWQYGPLSVLEYAVATRALEENGAPFPEMDAWTNSLIVRAYHGFVPKLDAMWVGGDFDDEQVYAAPRADLVDAVLAGPSTDQVAGWAAFLKEKQGASAGGFFYNAIAETRTVTAQDYRAQSPAPALWYFAHGTRSMYARTSWDDKAFWAVFRSMPKVVSDHWHFDAGSFVLSRGVDHLIVDPSRYGEPATFETNGVSAESTKSEGDYASTQTPFSQAELLWARGTVDAVYAARADIGKAFLFRDATDVTYGHREWVMLPEGEVVTIDRVHTAGSGQPMYVFFHANTGGGGKLALNGKTALGTVGGSQVAIHAVKLSGGAPELAQIASGDCKIQCSYPCGKCDSGRFPTDKYKVTVPGPFAVAIHAIDALATGEAPATVASLDDDAIDPAPKANAGVIGASIDRASKRTFVVASSAVDGASGASMTYRVPAANPSRHVVFDAPEDSSGKSLVTAAAQGDKCVITIAPGAGFAGHPVMFTASTAAEGCKLTEATDVAPGSAPDGGGAKPNEPNPNAAGGDDDSGCGCRVPRGTPTAGFAGIVLLGLAAALRLRRAR